jgi:hypothetical protein
MWEELQRPATLVAIALALVSILTGTLISYYFYNKSEKVGEIALLVQQVQVFDKERMGELPLHVVDATGHIITDNVFAANITIWNSGTAEIKKSDIRKPLQLVIGDGIRPLDIIASYPHDNLDQISLAPNGEIDWEHFDPNEGLKIRVVYANAMIARVALQGQIAGVRKIIEARPTENRSWSDIIFSIVNILIFPLLLWGLFTSFSSDALRHRISAVMSVGWLVPVYCIWVVGTLAVLIFSLQNTHAPPF